MDVMKELRKLGGCAGGKVIYDAAKKACQLRNIHRKHRTLTMRTRARFGQLFPHLDLSKVRFCINCSLPGNWFTGGGDYLAITFGNTIYFKGSGVQKTKAGLLLLMHELVHVDQVRRYNGESKFACEYGKGYLAAGNYADNPLEKEARDFVRKHPTIPPPGDMAILDWWHDKDFKGRHHRRELFSVEHGRPLKLVHNDAMKSLKFTASPGWRLQIFDNGGCKKSDDWGEVTFPNNANVKTVRVPRLGRQGPGKVQPGGCYSFHYVNGLPGKVSAIKHFGP